MRNTWDAAAAAAAAVMYQLNSNLLTSQPKTTALFCRKKYKKIDVWTLPHAQNTEPCIQKMCAYFHLCIESDIYK